MIPLRNIDTGGIYLCPLSKVQSLVEKRTPFLSGLPACMVFDHTFHKRG